MFNLAELIKQGSVVPPEQYIQLGKPSPKRDRKVVILKQIDSPVKEFAGHVILRDPISLEAAVAWEEALAECRDKLCAKGLSLVNKMIKLPGDDPELQKKRNEIALEIDDHFNACVESDNIPRCKRRLSVTQTQLVMLPAIIKCVQEWHIANLPTPVRADTFPGSPMKPRAELIAWLIKEINDIYVGEGLDADDPNA